MSAKINKKVDFLYQNMIENNQNKKQILKNIFENVNSSLSYRSKIKAVQNIFNILKTDNII